MGALPRSQTLRFDVSPRVLDLGVRVEVFTLGGLSNRKEDASFEELKASSLAEIRASLANEDLERDPILRGFRELHTRLGFSNRNFPAASEALLEYVHRQGTLPQINLLVDIYNLVSVETRLSLGAHDLEKVQGDVHLRLTDGSEGFHPLGAPGSKAVRPGAYAYIDDAQDVICLLEVKQVEKTRVTLQTSEALFIVQGNAATSQAEVRAGAQRLARLLKRFCGGQEHWL